MTRRRAPGVWRGWRIFCAWLGVAGLAWAGPFHLPTANRALFEAGGEARFYTPTTGREWPSGTFGCVRTDKSGPRLHEGIDIRALERDRRGEPTDAVNASADGVVAYVNRKPSLSNYGNYLLLRHRIEGLEVYTLYAHLRSVRAGLKAGDTVRAGEPLGVLGRTANTREGISKERAHVHFEINLVLHERYAAWHRQHRVGLRNDHGDFNGFNFLGLDPAAIFREQRRLGTNFSLVRHLQRLPELCRVQVRGPAFPWVRRYPQLVARNPVAEKQGVAGYELALAFNGIPIRVTPRAASELRPGAGPVLLSVNEAERAAHPCGRLLIKRGQAWTLLAHGTELLSLLTFR
jgi:peptidoglycan LD-endopeptidase LytH